MDVLGFGLFLVIGLLLGLLGGGGSILAVPVLVYALGVPPVLATAYSLFVVGLSSAWGAFRQFKSGLVDWRTGLVFGFPSLLAVYATRAWIVPALPEVLWNSSQFVFTRDQFLLVLFAVLMVLAAYSMIKPSKLATAEPKTGRYGLVILEGAVVGTLTGLVGAGGGFLIIPALVLLVGMDMKKAVATSLFIISIKSTLGFLGDFQKQGELLDWTLLGVISVAAVLGMTAGTLVAHRVPAAKLKAAFGWFVLLMGVAMLFKELVL